MRFINYITIFQSREYVSIAKAFFVSIVALSRNSASIKRFHKENYLLHCTRSHTVIFCVFGLHKEYLEALYRRNKCLRGEDGGIPRNRSSI